MGPVIVCEPVSRNEVILAVAAGALVLFSLVVSLVVPRYRPEFPGRRTGLFTLIALLLVACMLGAVEVFGAEEEHGAEAVETGTGTGEETTTAPETTGGSETGETTGEDGGGDVARGEEVFASAGCGSCHTMEAAGASGTVGPNLDELKPSLDATVEQVTNGGGAMPAFADQLSEEDIDAVAAYVVASTQR
jgi:mono/diheme cytochrome c family protein